MPAPVIVSAVPVRAAASFARPLTSLEKMDYVILLVLKASSQILQVAFVTRVP